MNEGTRVRVVLGPSQLRAWARNVGQAVNGQIGTIETVALLDHYKRPRVSPYLVRFDVPAVVHPKPIESFWFAQDELELLAPPVKKGKVYR